MNLRSERFHSTFLDPRHDFEPVPVPLEVRWDPLTGRSSRLLPEGSIPAPARHDLAVLFSNLVPYATWSSVSLVRELATGTVRVLRVYARARLRELQLRAHRRAPARDVATDLSPERLAALARRTVLTAFS